MAKFDYYQQYVKNLENANKITAHEEHILEFQAMCAKQIKEATPGIEEDCIEKMKAMLPPEPKPTKKQDVRVEINMKDVKKQIIDAFKKAFK